MSDSSVRTQLKYWAMLRTLHPVAIDLARVAVIRDADPSEFATPGGLSALVTRLGLNDEGIDEFPAHLHAHFGGLRIWQYPTQFGAYLHHLGQLGVRRYLEVGVRHGGSFVATVEYLRRVSTLERAIGVDVIRASALEDYAAATPGVEFAWLDSRSHHFRALLEDRGPFDLAFVDSHHEEDQCRCEVERLAPSVTMIALHDITNVECPGVARVWADLAAMPEWQCLEFIDQYEGLGPFMGIGLAVRRGTESPNGSPRGS